VDARAFAFKWALQIAARALEPDLLFNVGKALLQAFSTV
jgi:hypothetical protein